MYALMRELLEELINERDTTPQDSDIKDRPGTQPKKYYKGLPKSTKVARDKHFKSNKDYSPAPGDKGTKTKPSKHTEKFKQMFGENYREVIREMVVAIREDKVTKALKNKAEKANAPMSALRTIYNKGLAAWKTGHRPGASQHAWAMARVNSVLTGGPARKTDKTCLLYTSPSPRDRQKSRMPSSA